MPHSLHLEATSPMSRSMSRSDSSPRFRCTDTASAPSLMPSSTELTRILALGKGERVVLAERWMMRPTSRPWPRWAQRGRPLCIRTALAPPSATLLTVSRRSTRPAMGPTVVPWSRGTMMLRPVLRLKMRSSRTLLPMFMMSSGCGRAFGGP
ncbi:hypothetical protein DSECCO2_560290 [anaerobic digester metagenome]